MTRLALVPLLLLLALCRPAGAQERDVRAVVNRVAVVWQAGDARAVARLGSRSGIELELDGGRQGPLAPRQAAAMLRRVLAEVETVSVTAGAAEVTGGEPARAYGELSWISRAPGTTQTDRTRVFLALVREGDGWRITQIRLLR